MKKAFFAPRKRKLQTARPRVSTAEDHDNILQKLLELFPIDEGWNRSKIRKELERQFWDPDRAAAKIWASPSSYKRQPIKRKPIHAHGTSSLNEQHHKASTAPMLFKPVAKRRSPVQTTRTGHQKAVTGSQARSIDPFKNAFSIMEKATRRRHHLQHASELFALWADPVTHQIEWKWAGADDVELQKSIRSMTAFTGVGSDCSSDNRNWVWKSTRFTIGKKKGAEPPTGLVLLTNISPAAEPFHHSRQRNRLTVGVLKSVLQKLVRRRSAESAVRVAWALMHHDKNGLVEFLRRIQVSIKHDAFICVFLLLVLCVLRF